MKLKTPDKFLIEFVSKENAGMPTTALLTHARCQRRDFFFCITANKRQWNSIGQT